MRAGRTGWGLSLMWVALWLSACGSDEGASAPALRVSSTQLSFSNQGLGILQPPDQDFRGEILNLTKPVFIGVVYSDNGLERVAYDLGSTTFTVRVTPKYPAAVGLEHATDQIVIVACEDELCDKHIAGSPHVVDVTYTIDRDLTIAPGSLRFTHVLGTRPPGTQGLEIKNLFQLPWTLAASQGWLHLISYQISGSVTVWVDPAGLDTGLYSDNLVVTSTTQGKTLTVPVTLEVRAPTLSTDVSSLALGGSDGAGPLDQQLSLSLSTGTDSHGWTAAIDTGGAPRWLKLSSTSGTVSAAGTRLMASVDATGLQRDTLYSASVTFTARVEGHSVSHTVPVTLRLGAHKLWVADQGVGLVSTPSLSRLTHSVPVLDSWKLSTTPWTARSSQPWLSVPPSGTGALTLTANPSGLAPNSLHLATVTLGSGDSAVECNESIQVGLWVGDSSPNRQDSLPVRYQFVETDPIRPYAYLHDGGDTLTVHHVYTAGVVTRLSGLGSALGPMTISHDGSTLYVLDTAAHQIVPVNLSTLTAGSPWSVGTSNPESILYARPNGRGFILTPDGRVHEAATGAAVRPASGSIAPGVRYISVSLDGSLLCGVDPQVSRAALSCYGLWSSELAPGTVTLTARGTAPSDSLLINGHDVAINHDGSRVYAASQTLLLQSYFGVYDGQTVRALENPFGTSMTSAVEVGPDQKFYGTARMQYGAETQGVSVYTGTGSYVSSVSMSPERAILRRQLKVSGDGKRIVMLTSKPSLELATSP